MLKSQQEQLVAGLQELYKRMQNGLGWIGSPLEETSNGVPLTHDILERLGVLEPDVFEEDLTALQQRLTADGARFTQEQPSHDLHSDSVLSSIHKPVAQRPNVSNAFSLGLFLPTPPDQSHFPQNAQVIPPTTYSHIFPFSTITDLSLRWNTADDSIDFMNQFETSVMDSAMESDSFTQATLQEQFLLARINPCLTMEDPVGGEELQPYFNPTLV